MENFSFIDYLGAKKTVDDRALNQRVYQAFQDSLPTDQTVHVLEIAAGLGNMLERLLEWELFRSDVVYTAVDVSADYLATAATRLPAWAQDRGYEVQHLGENHFVLSKNDQRIEWQACVGDIYDLLNESQQNSQHWDCVIAHAFLDLVNLKRFLPHLFACLSQGALLYFTINFDGQTILLPEIEAETDRILMNAYHVAMDQPADGRDPRYVGTSRSSQALLVELPAAGAEILASGGSDWVVWGTNGRYPAQEADFLHNIISTVNNSLWDRVDRALLRPWIAERHAQIDRGELVYVAHQLDFLARKA